METLVDIGKLINPDLISKIKVYLEGNLYDDAIFHATKYLEAVLQDIGNKSNIGVSLVEQLFLNKDLIFSTNEHVNLGAQEIYTGVFRMIRNDRGHDSNTLKDIDVACGGLEECIQYLGRISFLLNLATQRNLKFGPQITSYQIMEDKIEILGDNFLEASVYIDSKKMDIITSDNTSCIIKNTKIQNGKLKIVRGTLQSNEVNFHNYVTANGNTYLVLESNLVLYSDLGCTSPYSNVTGVKLQKNEGGRQSIQVFPTKTKYTVGNYVSREFDDNNSCEESWLKDTGSDEVFYAFTGSLYFNGKILGQKGKENNTKLSIPYSINIPIGAIYYTDISLEKSDGMYNYFYPISKVSVLGRNDNVFGFDNGKGILHAKASGDGQLKVSSNALHATCNISVCTPITHVPYVVFYSNTVCRLQQICITKEDSILLTDQSNFIHELHPLHGKRNLLNLPKYGFIYGSKNYHESLIDRIYFDKTSNKVYFNSIRPSGLYLYDMDKKICSILIQKELGITIKGITSTNNKVYFANMKKQIGVYDLDSKEILYIDIQILSVDLCLVGDDKIVVSSGGGGEVIHIYSTKGDLLSQIYISELNAPTGICYKNDFLYIVGARCSNLYKYDLVNDKYDIICNFGKEFLGGICIDDHENIYVSVFSGTEGKIYKIMQ